MNKIFKAINSSILCYENAMLWICSVLGKRKQAVCFIHAMQIKWDLYHLYIYYYLIFWLLQKLLFFFFWLIHFVLLLSFIHQQMCLLWNYFSHYTGNRVRQSFLGLAFPRNTVLATPKYLIKSCLFS